MSHSFPPGSLDELRTDRLLLRRPQEQDRAGLHEMYADPKVMATLGGVKDAEATDTSFRRMVAHWDAHEFGYWTVCDPQAGAFAGRAGLQVVSVEGEPAVEVGYGLRSAYWGRGLATEIVLASVRAAFEVIGLRSLACFTLPTNRKSQRVMEKAGFRYERDFVHADLPHRLCRLDADRWRRELR